MDLIFIQLIPIVSNHSNLESAQYFPNPVDYPSSSTPNSVASRLDRSRREWQPNTDDTHTPHLHLPRHHPSPYHALTMLQDHSPAKPISLNLICTRLHADSVEESINRRSSHTAKVCDEPCTRGCRHDGGILDFVGYATCLSHL